VAHENARRRGKSSARKVAVVAAVLLGSLALSPAHALPVGETVINGKADFMRDNAATHLSINQHSDKLITDWSSFNVGAGERVTFNQPNSSSIALNRVLGTGASDIQGRIDANGQLFLVNPNGTLFGRGAQVNVGGLVVSTQGISNADFLAGNYRFNGTSGDEISNLGTLTATSGGTIALLGGKVSNRGVIQAQQGSIALGAGGDFTLNLDGNKLVGFQVNGALVGNLAHNGGLLKADGGQVLMTARSAAALMESVVNNQGVIEAKTLNQRAGTITLDGGNAKVVAGGSLNASALTAPGNGGKVEIKGADVEVNLATQVDTRANNGERGVWKISADNIRVQKDSTAGNRTLHASTLSNNLATTRVELAATSGDVTIDGAVATGSANASLTLQASRAIEINDKIALSGQNGHLQLDSGAGHRVNGAASVTLSGAGATFRSNGQWYNVIQNAAQLQNIDTNLGGRFILGNNICGSASNCNSSYYYGNLQAIGGPAGIFTGTFDGLGNTVGNFSIRSGGGMGLGLFAHSAGTLRNLKLANINVTDANSNGGAVAIGTLAGINSGTIANVNASNVYVVGGNYRVNAVGGLVGVNRGDLSQASVAGRVVGGSSSTAAGGLAGENIGEHSLIANSDANVTVDSGSMVRAGLTTLGGVGGLVGFNWRGRLTDVSSLGTTTGRNAGLNVGGLVGYQLSGKIDNAIASGNVSSGGSGYTGGLVGLNQDGDIAMAEARGRVSANSSLAVGGLLGLNTGNGKVRNVKASGAVEDRYGANVGGLIGSNTQLGGSLDTAEASGAVTGGANSRVGGLIGSNASEYLAHVSASGNVSGGSNSQVGGLIGFHAGNLLNASASGNVSGGSGSAVGGLVGTSNTDAKILSASSTSVVSGGQSSRVGGLVGENLGELLYGTFSGEVSGGYYARLGGLAGVNYGTVSYSNTSGKINYMASASGGQVYGGLAGMNYGRMTGNQAIGLASLLPPAGINYGELW